MPKSLHREPVRAESQAEREVTVGGDDTTVSLCEAPASIEHVSLRTPYLVYYGVIEGQAVLHINGESQTVEAGESLVVPPLQPATAEFPNDSSPSARYVALKVDREQARSLLNHANQSPQSAPDRWILEEDTYCHLERREGTNHVLRMLAYLFRSNTPGRDRLIDLNVKELIILLLQTPSRPLLIGNFSRHSSAGGLAAVVQYIQDNLDRHISIDELVEEACMSKSSFYRHFSDEFDMSPLEFITQERVIRARELLSDPENTVTSVSHTLGFSSTSHFIDMFKEHEGKTPKQYQLDICE